MTPNYEIVNKLIEKSKNKNVSSDSLSMPISYDFEGQLGNIRKLEQSLQFRTSTRFFNDTPVSYEDLIVILNSNIQYLEGVWGDIRNIEQYVIARNIDSELLDANSIYRYENENFIEVAKLQEKNFHELYLQIEFSYSPVTIILVGKIEKSINEYKGMHAYKNLLISAGSTLYHSWLQSVTMGYAGTVFAGTIQKALSQISDVDGFRKCQLFAFAFGYPKFPDTLKGGEK